MADVPSSLDKAIHEAVSTLVSAIVEGASPEQRDAVILSLTASLAVEMAHLAKASGVPFETAVQATVELLADTYDLRAQVATQRIQPAGVPS